MAGQRAGAADRGRGRGGGGRGARGGHLERGRHRPGAARAELGTEDDPYRGGGLGLTYVDSKHEGEFEALAAGVRLGVEVVVVNPSYVLGVPVDRSQPGETSTRTIGNYLRGRLPAVIDSSTDIVDVRDVARGHVRAAERG